MKVSQLSHLLEHLARGMEPLAAGPAHDLHALRTALTPFADKSVQELVRMLEVVSSQSAVVSGDKATDSGPCTADHAPTSTDNGQLTTDRVKGIVQQVRTMLDEIDLAHADSRKIEQTIKSLQAHDKADLDAVLNHLGIAGKSKGKSDAIARIRQLLHNHAEAATRVHLMKQHR